MRVLLVPVAGLLLALGLAGCGDDADDPADGPSDAPSDVVAGDPSAGDPAASGGDVDAVVADVTAIAPALESFYRGAPYPQSLEEAVASLDDAGLSLSPGNTLATYVYDPDAVEFAICIEDGAGAWATYDTAPMSVRESGADGGCPS